jgi:hypothetical protein
MGIWNQQGREISVALDPGKIAADVQGAWVEVPDDG